MRTIKIFGISLKWRTLLFVIIFIGVGLSIFFARNQKKELTTVPVTRGSISQEVTVTGKTKAREVIDLAFERSGRINHIYKQTGERVDINDLLVELDDADIAVQLKGAAANVDAEKARLEEMKRGTRPEEIQIKQTELEKAKQDLVNAYADVTDTLNDAHSKTDDAVRHLLDPFFLNDEESSPLLTFTIFDSAGT
ncbi:hypothetical protein HZC21_04950, partial [Candidatus Peregrinibacteria bacterium]|nr:hypothetical protein [Candidatus Peregrinibacteria bacterium]